jgi:hypothetical protein
MHLPASRLGLVDAMEFIPAQRAAAEEMAQTVDW